MIEAKHILELSKQNPRNAHALVARSIGERGHRAFFEFKGRQSCIEKAQAKPLPGASGDAFTKGEIKSGDKIVHRVTPARFAVLQALESPLLQMIENAMTKKKADVNFKPSEQWEVCYVFTEDAETVYNELESNGAKSIRELAKKSVGLKWEPASVNFVMLAVLEHVKRHIETTVKFAAEMEKEGQVSFFREQPDTSEKRPA